MNLHTYTGQITCTVSNKTPDHGDGLSNVILVKKINLFHELSHISKYIWCCNLGHRPKNYAFGYYNSVGLDGLGWRCWTETILWDILDFLRLKTPSSGWNTHQRHWLNKHYMHLYKHSKLFNVTKKARYILIIKSMPAYMILSKNSSPTSVMHIYRQVENIKVIHAYKHLLVYWPSPTIP